MNSQEERLRNLLRLFVDNKATEQEIKEMLGLLRLDEGDKELESLLLQLRQESGTVSNIPIDWDMIWNNIHQQAIYQAVSPVKKMTWWRVAAAAVFFLFCTGVYLFIAHPEKKETVKTAPVQTPGNDVQPGGNKAILTLANGSKIILDSASNGKLAQQGNADIVKLGNGVLAYTVAGDKEKEVLYNTMSTPPGGQYKLRLPDGTEVWLNSISSIHYPTAFVGKERKVEITGEVYFEVAKNANMPFKVSVNGMEVSVLGTHFNINAYDDEPNIKTTLLEGSVKVSKGANFMVINPGQQTQVDINGKIKVIHDADVEEAIAWKDGHFQFKNAEMKTVMRQILRWYDIKVEYQGNIPERYFTADISRNKSLTTVLKIFKLSDVDFKLEGKKLTITP